MIDIPPPRDILPPPEMKTHTYLEETLPLNSPMADVLRIVLGVALFAFVIYGAIAFTSCDKRGGVLAVSLGVPPLVCVAPLQEAGE